MSYVSNEMLGSKEGSPLEPTEIVGCKLGAIDGEGLDNTLGSPKGSWEKLGAHEGSPLGPMERDGFKLGDIDGEELDETEGCFDGVSDGSLEGLGSIKG